jgi:hypothetical protein
MGEFLVNFFALYGVAVVFAFVYRFFKGKQ